MKTKTLLFSIMLLACSFSVDSAELLVSEDFSSAAWQAELLAQDPAYEIPATTSATYAVPSTATYFEKYTFNGAFMIDGVTTIRTCADSIAHPENGIEHKESSTGAAVAFRFRGAKGVPNVGTYMEFPLLPNAGLMTLHVRNGNSTASAILELQQYDELSSAWSIIKTFDVQPYNDVNITSLDEIVTYNVASNSAIKLRLIGGPKFIYMYRVDIGAYDPSLEVKSIRATSFKIAGRKVIAQEPIKISLYNAVGMLVYESKTASELTIPASIGNGFFMIKSNHGSQKIVLK